MFLIPSCITVTAIFCGFLAIISAFNGRFEYAAKCIVLAIILDGLDGRVARRLNATSDFGREFDSLSDVISFGVAPAALMYVWAFKSGPDEFGVLVAFFFVVCGATRLARFNITTSDEPAGHFQGLPTPGAAAAVAAIVYFHPDPVSGGTAAGLMLAYLTVLGGLMVSTLPFFSVKKIRLTPANLRTTLLLISALVALAWYHNRLMLLVLAGMYISSGPLAYLLKKFAPGLSRKFEGAL
ncbi:CDP-diacylglycerol--serine O-phosphatidyltransferase [bacterium J17]|nr:CDP-diacylglycerol--serine O-phosphatidyltransferase [bacterium J17]